MVRMRRLNVPLLDRLLILSARWSASGWNLHPPEAAARERHTGLVGRVPLRWDGSHENQCADRVYLPASGRRPAAANRGQSCWTTALDRARNNSTLPDRKNSHSNQSVAALQLLDQRPSSEE